jgi:hypothetical protein
MAAGAALAGSVPTNLGKEEPQGAWPGNVLRANENTLAARVFAARQGRVLALGREAMCEQRPPPTGAAGRAAIADDGH